MLCCNFIFEFSLCINTKTEFDFLPVCVFFEYICYLSKVIYKFVKSVCVLIQFMIVKNILIVNSNTIRFYMMHLVLVHQ